MRILVAVAALLALLACQTAPAAGVRDGAAADRAPDDGRVRLPAPSASPPVVVAPPPVTFRWAIQQPGALVPYAAADTNALAVVDALFDSLTAYDGAARVVPSAARSWSAAGSSAIWTFHLRPGATFHDGTPVTAGDVRRGWEKAVRKGVVGYHLRDVVGYDEFASGRAKHLQGLEVVDDLTLRVSLVRPQPDFPAVVAHPVLAPLPPSFRAQTETAFEQQPIGNGPFRAHETPAHGRFIRLARFEAWQNAPPARGRRSGTGPGLQELVFVILDPDAAYLAFQQRRVDFTLVPPGALSQAAERYGHAPAAGGVGVLTAPTPTLYFIGFATDRPPFDDPDVRRAVALAIDREELARDTLEGNVDASVHALPRALPGAPAPGCVPCQHNPGAARKLFDEHDVRSLTLSYNRGGGHDAVARRVRDDLAGAGVTVALHEMDFNDYLGALRGGDLTLYRLGWTVDYPTLDNVVTPLFHSALGLPEAHGGNYGRYASEEVDALIEAARTTPNWQERAALYRQAASVAVQRDQAIVPLFTYRQRALSSDRASTLVYDMFGRIDLARLRGASSPAPLR